MAPNCTSEDTSYYGIAQWLDIFDARLEGDAAKWADNTPIICRMLVEGAINTRTTINEVETANLALENLKQ